MEVQTIDSRMRALTKKHRELDRTSTSKIWNELIREHQEQASVLFLMFFVLHLIWKMEEELLVI